MVGDEYTIVDMAAWGWIDKAPFVLGEDALNDYPNLKRWFEQINARPAVAKAREIESGIDFKSTIDEEAARALFPQNFPKA